MSNKQKFVTIALPEESGGISSIIDDYCKEAGLITAEYPFCMGFIHGLINPKTKEDLRPILNIQQISFFAGILFALKNKNKIKMSYEDSPTAPTMDNNLNYVG